MELRAYLVIMANRWKTIVGVLVACLIAAGAASVLAAPTYTARAQLFVSTQVGAGNVNQELFQGSNFSSDRVKSYTQLVSSPTVLQPVIAELGLRTTVTDLAESVRAEAPADTVLIDIEADAASPALAARLADSLGERLASVIEDLERGRDGSSPVRATLVTPAIPPDAPSSPSIPLNVGLGLILGLVAGIAAGLLRERLDTTFKSQDEMAGVGVPVLADVVRVRGREFSPIVHGDLLGSRSESFRQLRTNLQFAAVGRFTGAVVVTSALPEEGKSSVAGNLAMSLAQAGARVCLVDCDLRRPSVAGYFGLIQEAGTTTVVVGRATVDEVLQPVDHGLQVITSGVIPPNPTELLISPAFGRMLAELKARFEVVVLDAPPVLPAADAAILAAAADGVLFVVRASRTTRDQVQRALGALDKAHARVLGAVLNMVAKNSRAAGYGEQYVAHAVGAASDADDGEQRAFLAAGGVSGHVAPARPRPGPGPAAGPPGAPPVSPGPAQGPQGRPSPAPRGQPPRPPGQQQLSHNGH